MIRNKKFLMLAGIVCFGIILSYPPLMDAFAQPGTRAPHEIEVFAGMGLDTIVHTALADILNKNHPWIRASAVKTEDVDSHLPLAEKRDPNRVIYDINNNVYMTNCLPGVSKPLYTNVRWIAAWHTFLMFFATTDPKIKSLSDCAGKKINILPGPTTSGTNLVIIETLKALGVYEKVTIKRLGFAPGTDALRDGLVDVTLMVCFGGVATQRVTHQPFFKELLTAKKDEVYVVAWPHSALDKVRAKLGYARLKGTLPAGTLPLQKKPVECSAGVAPALACQKAADTELIYEITKTIGQNSHKFKDYHPELVHINPENMVKLLPLYSDKEVHPGAIKYYKEAGVWEEAWKNRYFVGPKIID
jgi:TRAP transporter TAXI family solute receptor